MNYVYIPTHNYMHANKRVRVHVLSTRTNVCVCVCVCECVCVFVYVCHVLECAHFLMPIMQHPSMRRKMHIEANVRPGPSVSAAPSLRGIQTFRKASLNAATAVSCRDCGRVRNVFGFCELQDLVDSCLFVLLVLTSKVRPARPCLWRSNVCLAFGHKLAVLHFVVTPGRL